MLPLIFLAIGAFTKSAQVPFQSWLLGAMVAPTPVSALLHASTMVNLGVYLLVRISPSIGPVMWLTIAIAAIGGLSFLIASILALTQSNAKRVLAFSTIGNLGLIVLCVGISTGPALVAALILLLYHAISKALMFLSVGVVHEEVGSYDIEDMVGLRKKMPFISLAMFIGIVTIVLPPFGIFASKWLISEASVSAPIIAFLLAAGFTAISVFYFKWLGNILTDSEENERHGPDKEQISSYYRWTTGSLVVAAIVLSMIIGAVVTYILNPYILMHFQSPVSSNLFSLSTSEGTFPVLIIMLFLIVVIAVFGIMGRKTNNKGRSIPYACGEDIPFTPSGSYYLSEARVSTVIRVSEVLGALIIVSTFILSFVMGGIF